MSPSQIYLKYKHSKKTLYTLLNIIRIIRKHEGTSIYIPFYGCYEEIQQHLFIFSIIIKSVLRVLYYYEGFGKHD